LFCILLPIHHLIFRLVVSLGDRIAAPQRSSLFPKLVVLLDLRAAWQAPSRVAVESAAAADSKLLPYSISLESQRKARDQERDCKAHGHVRSITAAIVRVFWALGKVCKTMLSLAKHGPAVLVYGMIHRGLNSISARRPSTYKWARLFPSRILYAALRRIAKTSESRGVILAAWPMLKLPSQVVAV
jgi:hypothetical protein